LQRISSITAHYRAMIKHVKITNFKSLGNIDVCLHPVTVLIGRSGTGKSNFVEALRFLRSYLVQRSDPAQAQGGWPALLPITATEPFSLAFSLTFDVPGVDEDYQYELVFQQQGNPRHIPAFKAEKLSLGERVLYHQDQAKWIQPPQLVNLPPAGTLTLGGLTGVQEVSVAHVALTQGLGCYAFPDTVLLQNQGFGGGGGGVPANVASGLADTGTNFLAVFQAIVNNLQVWNYRKEIFAALQLLNPSIRSVELRMPQQDRLLVSHAINGRALVLDLTQESEGFRRFLAHVIALYQTPPKQTLVFEEPERGIHPGALGALAEQFKAAPDAGRGQVILTTHSPELLDYFDADQLRVVDIRDYRTNIGPVAEEQKDAIREQLLRTGELLTVDPARLAGVVAPEG
jgi:predicted ATPase